MSANVTNRTCRSEDVNLKQNLVKEIMPTVKHLSSLPRVLSSHVSTRLYRSPEVILLEKHYHTPVDIWATGVMMAEMF